jgi:hypothetical protein
MQIALIIATGIIQLVAALLGAYMSGRRHPAWFAAFIVLGLLGVSATTWQGVLNVRSANESKFILRKISDDIASFTGHPIDSASLENIQRGISELKETRSANATSQEAPADRPQRTVKRRTLDSPKRAETPQVGLSHDESQRVDAHPWWLTPDQISGLAKRMKQFAGIEKSGSAVVGAMFWDSETTTLAYNIVDALRAAGWDVPEKGLWHHRYVRHEPGLYLITHSQRDAPRVTSELVSAFQEFGLALIRSTDEKIPEGEFRILVAARPTH